MSFDGAQAEPKNLFLNNLIALDFYTATELYRTRRYSNAICGMEQTLAMIGAHNIGEIKQLAEQLDAYSENGEAEIKKLKAAFRQLQKYLYEKWFSELNLGVVPTSTLEGEAKRPETKIYSPNQSNQI